MALENQKPRRHHKLQLQSMRATDTAGRESDAWQRSVIAPAGQIERQRIRFRDRS
jgi:hypothetical protein